ncbi:MAG TPA: DegQ family serine endoprotease [Vicinamibacteria bacterium]|jgi:serine protease Do|nr:DegQ family serine endoprotease [Vicinamibacteria bacterium]
MNTRTKAIASFFSVAMAAMLLGALVTTQIQRPETAMARPPEAAVSTDVPSRATGALTLDTFRDIARRETPGVVNINTRKVVKRQRFQDPFRDFFGDDMMDRFLPRGGSGNERQTQTSLGSGFIIEKDGHILTNRHVVEGADQISVTLSSGKTYEAKLVGKDARTDVALLKIEPKEGLTTLELGDSDQIDVGEWVMAVGNPFGLGGNSVTVGVISFKGRALALGVQGTTVDMIQTDAAINPGNSGGPLLNTRGQVVGINTLIITGGEHQSSGVGFSVPINVAREILPQLRDKGKVTRGWLGIQIQSVDEDMAKSLKMKEGKGAIINQLTPGGPAEKAGLKAEDVIVTADARKIQDNGDLSRYIASKPPGTTVHLGLLRGGEEKALSVTLGTFPDEPGEAEAAEGRKGKLGMTLQDLNPSLAERLELPRGTKGVVVRDVEAGEAAEQAGLKRGDVIVSVNGSPVTGVDEFEQAIEAARKEGVARLRVRDSGGFRFVVLKVS